MSTPDREYVPWSELVAERAEGALAGGDFVVYALVDGEERIRYVGATGDKETRSAGHRSRLGNLDMRVICTAATRELARALEVQWIEWCDARGDLLNVRDVPSKRRHPKVINVERRRINKLAMRHARARERLGAWTDFAAEWRRESRPEGFAEWASAHWQAPTPLGKVES